MVGGKGGRRKKKMDAFHQIHPQRIEAGVRMSGDNMLKHGGSRLMVVDSVGVCTFVCVVNLFGKMFRRWKTNVRISMYSM